MWQRFCQANSWLEANVIRDEIQSFYQEDPGRDKIMKQLGLYFEDPALICTFGRADLSEDILKKHEGPAEVESLFDKYKHHYGDPDKDQANDADTILYGFYEVRRRLRTRFLADLQNSKLPAGVKEVTEKYCRIYKCRIDPPSPRKPRASLKPLSRKSQRQEEGKDNEQPPFKRTKQSPVVRSLSFEEGDMNVPLEIDKGKASISSYSKSKGTRTKALRRLLYTYKPRTDAVLLELEKKVEEAKKSEEVDVNIPASQYTTVDEIDQDFQILTKNISFEQENVKGESLIMATSQHSPDYSCWKTLNVIQQGTAENLDKVPLNIFFEISTSSPVYSLIRMVLDSIISHQDTFTTVEKSCFRYVKEKSKNMIFLFIYVMTNKGVVRNKDMPFLFQYVIPFGSITSYYQTISIEGLYHIVPRRSVFTEDLLQTRLDTDVSLETRNSIVKTFKKYYPPETELQIFNFSNDSIPKRFDGGISKNSIGIIKVKKIKENPVAVLIVSYDAETVLLRILKPVGQSSLRWRNPGDTTCTYSRAKLLATSVPSDITEDDTYVLHQSPNVTLKNLGIC